MYNRSRLMLASALALVAGIPAAAQHAIPQIVTRKPRRVRKPWFNWRTKTHRYPHGGPRECARRQRQIEAGQLGISNGLHIARPEWIGIDPGAASGDRTVVVDSSSQSTTDVVAMVRALEAGRA
ncbi:MAG: hypothetical protein ACREO4_06405 [Lysobacter sp.]